MDNKLKDLLQKMKTLKKDQILILFLVGVLLMIITIPTRQNNEAEGTEDVISAVDSREYQDEVTYVKRLEKQLEEVLSQMEGAGEVTVMITLESSAEQIIEKDTAEDTENISETDSQGGTRNTVSSVKEETTIYGSQDSDSQTPYVRKSIMPKVEGVVVIASGGDDSIVVKNITEVIQALFGIETHKIRIVKKN